MKRKPQNVEEAVVAAVAENNLASAQLLKLAKAVLNVQVPLLKKVSFTAPNPNVRRDRSKRETVKSTAEFKLGNSVKVLKVVDRRGNVECVLNGKIKSMTNAGAFVTDSQKRTDHAEWFPFKSKMQWLLHA